MNFERQRKRHLKINIWEMMTIICDYFFFLASFIVDRARSKWTGRNTVEVKIYRCELTLLSKP